MKVSVNKGLNINLEGSPAKKLTETRHPKVIAIKPTDFPNLMPKMLVKVGDEVKCGSPVFCDKYNDQIIFSSPVSGQIKEIVRGAKRRRKPAVSVRKPGVRRTAPARRISRPSRASR